MKLYLLRHARAEVARAGRDDARRALTRDGRERLIEVLAGLRALDWDPQRIVHSPWLRATQTADVLARARRGRGDIETRVHAGLARAPDAQLVAELAADCERGARITRLCCVGHEPWLSELAALLCDARVDATGKDARRADAARAREPSLDAGIELKKAGVIELDGQLRAGGMRVCGVLQPRVLRRLGGVHARPRASRASRRERD